MANIVSGADFGAYSQRELTPTPTQSEGASSKAGFQARLEVDSDGSFVQSVERQFDDLTARFSSELQTAGQIRADRLRKALEIVEGAKGAVGITWRHFNVGG